MTHLETRHGNTEEMEKKQWRELRIHHPGKLRSPEWRSFMARFMAGAALVGATQDEAFTTLMDAVPIFIRNWIQQKRITRKYQHPRLFLRVGPGLDPQLIKQCVQNWCGILPKVAMEAEPGVFDVEMPSQKAVERLAECRGQVINLDGRRLEVFMPPIRFELGEVLQQVAERLECQEEGGMVWKENSGASSGPFIRKVEGASDTEEGDEASPPQRKEKRPVSRKAEEASGSDASSVVLYPFKPATRPFRNWPKPTPKVGFMISGKGGKGKGKGNRPSSPRPGKGQGQTSNQRMVEVVEEEPQA
jgi:hypothetical protein